jgi:hypothetical protein
VRYHEQDAEDLKTWEIIAICLIVVVMVGLVAYIALKLTDLL